MTEFIIGLVVMYLIIRLGQVVEACYKLLNTDSQNNMAEAKELLDEAATKINLAKLNYKKEKEND